MSHDMSVKNLFQLEGRVALITGAGGYLGRSFATALGEAGAHVILNGRSLPTLESLARELSAKSCQVSIASFDVTQEDQVERHIARIAGEHGRLDILVNNAYSGRSGTLQTATCADFEKAYQLCVT